MSGWLGWLYGAGLLLVFELLSGSFYFLMIAIGLVCGALAALAGADPTWQIVVAAGVGVLATLLLRRSRFGKPARRDATRDASVNLDIGQTVVVPDWRDGKARVMYRGALWDVELAAGGEPVAGAFTIREVRGSCLIVA